MAADTVCLFVAGSVPAQRRCGALLQYFHSAAVRTDRTALRLSADSRDFSSVEAPRELAVDRCRYPCGVLSYSSLWVTDRGSLRPLPLCRLRRQPRIVCAPTGLPGLSRNIIRQQRACALLKLLALHLSFHCCDRRNHTYGYLLYQVNHGDETFSYVYRALDRKSTRLN